MNNPNLPSFNTQDAQFCGRFQFTKRNAVTHEITQQTDWMNNIVLNSGLNQLFSELVFMGIAVGTGDSTPIATQTDLDNRFARSSTQQGSEVKGFITEPIPYNFIRRTYRFAAGVFNNTTIKEVGIHTNKSGAPLFNRALIVDAQGNPTSITLLDDEYLDVTAELRLYFSNAITTGSFDLVDKNNQLIRTVHYTAKFASQETANVAPSWGVVAGTNNRGYNLIAFTGLMSDTIQGRPSGTRVFEPVDSWKTTANYVADSFCLDAKITVPLNSGNAQPIKSLWFANGIFSYQFELAEPIQKTADELLIFNCKAFWGRYTRVIE